jgi:hypothetical protein
VATRYKNTLTLSGEHHGEEGAEDTDVWRYMGLRILNFSMKSQAALSRLKYQAYDFGVGY